MSWSDTDPGQGNPDGLLVLAADLQADADDAATAARMLRGVQNNASDAVWKGTSADAFRDRIDKVPGHLDKLNASYADAAAGLRTYAASVRQIADDARVQQQNLQQSQADLTSAQSAQAAWTPPPHPATGQPDPSATNPHDAQVSTANATIKKAKARLSDLASQRHTADGKLVGVLNHAHSEGMKNKHWWQKVLDVASDILSKITIVLMVVALVAIVVLAIVQPELIPGLLVLATEALTALSAAQLAVDGARKASGEDVSWASLALDAVALVPGLGEAGIGLKGAELSGKLAETFPRAASALSKTASVIRENSLVSKGFRALERLRNPGDGWVTFKPPPGATPEEIAQMNEYTDAANAALKKGELSPTGRVPVKGELKVAKDRAAALERKRAEQAGTPYGGNQAAHLPDTTWSGTAEPPGGWGSHTVKVNTSIGAQSQRYPIGFKPSGFRVAPPAP